MAKSKIPAQSFSIDNLDQIKDQLPESPLKQPTENVTNQTGKQEIVIQQRKVASDFSMLIGRIVIQIFYGEKNAQLTAAKMLAAQPKAILLAIEEGVLRTNSRKNYNWQNVPTEVLSLLPSNIEYVEPTMACTAMVSTTSGTQISFPRMTDTYVSVIGKPLSFRLNKEGMSANDRKAFFTNFVGNLTEENFNILDDVMAELIENENAE